MKRTSALAEVAEAWHSIETAGSDGNPFLSRAWIDGWSRHRGGALRPWILRADEESTIAAFGQQRVVGVRVLRLLGHEDSDFAGILSRHGSARAWDATFAELARRRGEWDLLHLHSVPDLEEIVQASARHLGTAAESRVYEGCPSVTMAASWDAFLAARKKLRYEVRRWAKRLEEQGEVTIEALAPAVSVEVIDSLESVERDSWKWEHGNPAFKGGTQREFLSAVLRDPAMPARVWRLSVGGSVAAVAIVLESRSRWYYYFASYRQSVRNAGSLLLARIIEAAHVAGCTSVSLLRGDHGYKEAWADAVEQVHEVLVPSDLRGRLASLAYRARWRAARSPLLHSIRSRALGVGNRRKADATD